MKSIVGALALSLALLAPLAGSASPTDTPTHVPPGKTWVYYEHGRVIATVPAGGETFLHHPRDEPTVDCFRIACPGNWRAGTVCWECIPRK